MDAINKTYKHAWRVGDYIIRKGVENPAKREIIGIAKFGYMLSKQNHAIDWVSFKEEELWGKVKN